MQFINKRQDLIDNILTFEDYLKSETKEEKKFAQDLVRKGKSICVYKLNGENHFAPIRFLGYKDNNMKDHLANEGKDDRNPNSTVTKVVGNPFHHDTIDKKFMDYVVSLGLEAPDNKRNYWRIKDERGKNLDIKL